jgi:hypothetical protein
MHPKGLFIFLLFSLHACRSDLFTWLSMLMSMLMLFFDQTCDQGWCAQFGIISFFLYWVYVQNHIRDEKSRLQSILQLGIFTLPCVFLLAWLCSVLVCSLVSYAWVIFLFCNFLSRYLQAKTTIFKFRLRFGAPSLTLPLLFSMHTLSLPSLPRSAIQGPCLCIF